MILGFFFWSRNARGRVSKALITVKWRNYFAPMDSVETLRADVESFGGVSGWKDVWMEIQRFVQFYSLLE